MERYYYNSVCPKCRWDRVTSKYEYGKIRRTCTRCQYWWYQAPLDEEVEVKDADGTIAALAVE